MLEILLGSVYELNVIIQQLFLCVLVMNIISVRNGVVIIQEWMSQHSVKFGNIVLNHINLEL